MPARFFGKDYELIALLGGTDDWRDFHKIQRKDVFNMSAAEYDPLSHDRYNPYGTPDQIRLLMRFRGTAVGISTLDMLDSKMAVTRNLAVAEEFRGQGHGLKLGKLTKVYGNQFGMKGLVVSATETTASFYRKLGFIEGVWDPRELERVPDPTRIIQMECKWR